MTVIDDTPSKSFGRRQDIRELSARSRRAALTLLPISVVLAILSLLFAQRTGDTILRLGALLLAGLSTLWIWAWFAGRRERAVTSGWLILSGLLVAFPALSAMIENLGFVLGIASILLFPALAASLLPTDHVRRAILFSVLVGVSSLIIDFYSPLDRLRLAPLEGVLPLISSALIVLLSYIVVRQFRNYTLRTKLIIGFLAVALIPLSLLAYLNARATRQALTQEANQKLFSAAAQTAGLLDSFIDSNLDAARTQAQITIFEEFMSMPDAEQAESELREDVLDLLLVFKRRNVTNLMSYGLLDRNGRNILDTQEALIGGDESGRDYFRMVMENGRVYASHVQISPFLELPSIYFSSPIRNEEGRMIGVLRFQFRARELQELIVETAGLAGPESFAVLFDEHYIHLAHNTAPETILKLVAPLDAATVAELQSQMRIPDAPPEELTTNLPELLDKLDRARTEPFFEAEDVATGDRINQVAVTEMQTQPWLVAFFQPQDVLFTPVEAQARSTVLLAILIASGVALAALAVAEQLSKPITRLTEAAMRLAEGDLAARAEAGEEDEIGLLAHTFNIMAARLRDLIMGLEARVAERTRALERRASQLQVAAEVAKDAAVIRDVDQLLDEAVRLISSQFGYYHAGAFLIDPSGEYAVLHAASSEGGKRMLERRHKLAVGKVGIVGYATGTGKARIALDVGEDAIHFANPDLPLTRSEVAVPLAVGDSVIGALDVQSVEPDAFDDQDVAILQTMADQLAIAIENVRLLDRETRVALQRRQALEVYRSLTQLLGYDELLTNVAQLVADLFSYARVTLALAEGQELIVRSAAARSGFPAAPLGAAVPIGKGILGRAVAQRSQVAVQIAAGSTRELRTPDPLLDDMQTALAVPLISRGNILGSLAIEKPGGEVFDDDEIEVVELIANQIAVALENARLFEETEETLKQVDALYRQQTSTAWAELLSRQLEREQQARYTASHAPLPGSSSKIERPIALRGEVIGQFDVEGLDPGKWSEEELALLEAVAAEVADQLEQVRLMQEVRTRATQMETAAEIARVATGVLDLEAILTRSVRLIQERFGYYHVALYLSEGEPSILRLQEASGAAASELKSAGVVLPIGSGSVVGLAAEQGESRAVPDVWVNDPTRTLPGLEEAASELAVPLKIGDQVIGVIDVRQRTPHAFDKEEIAVLETLADQLAVAVQNARLFRETLRRAEREQAVVEVTGRIRASRDVESMLRTAVQEMRTRLGARRGVVRLISGSFDQLDEDGSMAEEESGAADSSSETNGRMNTNGDGFER